MSNAPFWSIDLDSGHCCHPLNIDAYIASAGSLDYIPVLGPYTISFKNAKDLAPLAVELIKDIEENYPAKHTVFGSISAHNSSTQITALGQTKNWLPDYASRSNWLYSARSIISSADLKALLAKEWRPDFNNRSITHFSGIKFDYAKSCFSKSLNKMFRCFEAASTVDSDHCFGLHKEPELDAMVHGLGNIGMKVLCIMNDYPLTSRIVRIHPPANIWQGPTLNQSQSLPH